jgi:predicted esterase
LLGHFLVAAAIGAGPSLTDLVQSYLWSDDVAARERARTLLESDPALTAATAARFRELEDLLRRGRRGLPPPPPRKTEGDFPVQELTVRLPHGGSLPVLVQLPPDYSPDTPWPALLAMHGGPPPRTDMAWRGAARMIEVWKEPAAAAKWIVMAPVMTHVVSAGERTEDRLPYDALRPEEMEAIIGQCQKRFSIDPDRIVATGISLGSNFSIALAASRPDRFAAIVPVSTEGESRESLLRNLITVPVYVLQGARDRNIRATAGPRALRAILDAFGYGLAYREFEDRAHEGFEEHYRDVLAWAGQRPRPRYPREVLRVPHPGIMPPSRRVHWVEADTRQALLRARVAGPNRLEVTARWALEIRVYLHDRLVDLERPVEIWVNGEKSFSSKVARSIPFALEQVRQLDDPGRVYATSIALRVPRTEGSLAAGRALSESLRPRHPEGLLSFWEMYAVRALEERFPSLGLEGKLVSLVEGEQAAVAIAAVDPGSPFHAAGLRPGDLLLEVGGEPLFEDRGLETLHAWLLRELTSRPRDYPLRVRRDGRTIELLARFSLGPYR